MRRIATTIATLAALLLAAAASADLTTRIESLDLDAAPHGIFWVTVPHDGGDWVEPELSDLWAEFVLTVSARTTSSQYELRRVVAGLAMQGYATPRSTWACPSSSPTEATSGAATGSGRPPGRRCR